MNRRKEQFKKWLIANTDAESKHKASVNNYLKKIDEICQETFPNMHDLQDAWNQLSDLIIPVLAKYYERANKEYKLDRITIWDAIGYFHKIIHPIYEASGLVDDINEAKLYLFDGKDNYIDTVHVKDLYEYTRYFNGIVFEGHIPSKILTGQERETNFTNKIIRIIQENNIKNPENVALHITYKPEGKYTGKFVLEKFCNYLQHQAIVLQSNPQQRELLQTIVKSNPTQTINGNYTEIRHLTGEHSAQVTYRFKSKIAERPDNNYVLTQDDLAQIFHIDEVTVCELMSRFTMDRKASGKTHILTILREYYGIDAVNTCLEEYHHSQCNRIDTVDYTKEGFEAYWCTRAKALKIIGIKKQAFYNRVKNNSIYIDYAKQAPKYYIPHLEQLKKDVNISRIRRYYNNKKY